jgi:hypothetical protein
MDFYFGLGIGIFLGMAIAIVGLSLLQMLREDD